MSAPEINAWMRRLEAMQPARIELGLERVRAAMAGMGLPARLPVPTLLVGGTNGKGSAVAYLKAMLSAAGYRVGAYTSPHLLHYNERIAIGDQLINDDALVATFEAVEAGRGDLPLTYFEFGTLAAVQAFLQAEVEIILLEVGLGGRLDAVNAFEPDLSLLMSLDLDHRDWLGPDRESIAHEKAGIFRTAVPAVCADPQPPLAVAAAAEGLHLPLYQAGRDFRVQRAGADNWDWTGPGGELLDLPLPALAGGHQLANAAACICALRVLAQLKIPEQAVRAGLANVRMAGRFQSIQRTGRPTLILDVAHNPDAARALAANLAGLSGSGRVLAVVGMLADKDHAATLEPLIHHVDRWFCITPESPRALDAGSLASILRGLGASRVEASGDPARALRSAEAGAGNRDVVLVFGSFLTVAAAAALEQLDVA